MASKQKAPTPPLIVIEDRVPHGRVWSADSSLRPGPEMIEAAAEGQPEACAIRDAYKPVFFVKTLSRDEYEALIERCSGIVFAEGK